jgi:Collagenase and related proteases
MKKIIIPISEKQIYNLENKIDGIILPLKDYSANYVKTFTLNEVTKIKEEFNKKIYIFINKNILNEEIDNLKTILNEVSKLDIDGVFFYDLAILNLYKKNNYNFKLIWSQEHFTTNSKTISYYINEGVYSSYLSSEITKREMIEILKEINKPLFINVFGYIPMFTSRRNLINNYKKTFKINDENEIYYIEKEGKKCPIYDNEHGSFVYSYNILETIKECLEFDKINEFCAVFNGNLIEEDSFLKTINIFDNINKNNISQKEKELYELYDNLDKGFLYNETIYRVKK